MLISIGKSREDFLNSLGVDRTKLPPIKSKQQSDLYQMKLKAIIASREVRMRVARSHLIMQLIVEYIEPLGQLELNKVSKDFYTNIVPLAMKPCPTDRVRIAVEKMLASDPKGCSDDAYATFRKLGHLTLEDFNNIAKLENLTYPNFD